MHRSPLRLAALLLAAAMSIVACSTDSDDATESIGAETNAGEQTSAASVLEVSATTADGSSIDLGDFVGQDLLLWFWAPW